MVAGIFTAHSNSPDTATAVKQAVSTLPLESSDFVLLLHGPNHTGQVLQRELKQFRGTRFFGCSTSGEITPHGYHDDSLVAISFDRNAFSCVARRIDKLGEFGFKPARELILSMQWELRQQAPDSKLSSTFSLMLIDSLSQAEEFVAAALGSELGSINLMGASAGDNWKLEQTPVLYDGEHYDDSAVVLLVHTTLDFKHYNFHNFTTTDRRGVITSATPSQRLVHEINGIPAVEEYSRLCEVELPCFTQELLANYPAIITVGDRVYPRGFLQILDDGSLRCACAIDEGVVFRVAAQVDYLQQLQTAFERVHHDLGQQTMILGFECAARRQLVEQKGLKEQIPPLFAHANAWGFSCMGEQSNSLNMNNSFNALAFRLPS